MSLDDASDLLMSVSSASTCCLEITSSELSDVCCASAVRSTVHHKVENQKTAKDRLRPVFTVSKVRISFVLNFTNNY